MITIRTAATVAGAALLVLATGACGSSSDESTSPATTQVAPSGSSITVSDAWCRASPSMATAGACYMVVTNDGDTDDAIVSVSAPTDVAPVVEMHETVAADKAMPTDDTMASGGDMGTDDTMHTDDTMASGGDMGGAMTMKPVESIPVPAGGEAVLKPGGYHVMLLDLVNPLEVGQTVKLTIELESGQTLEVDAEVRTS